MTLRLEGSIVYLEGDCTVDQAEPLAAALDNGALTVDLSQCQRLHSALAQALLRYRPTLQGASRVLFIRDVLAPALSAAESEQ